VRADLPPGTQAANLVHAAGESSPGDLEAGTLAVVLVARDEAHLRQLAARMKAAGVAHVLITEPDAPHFGAAMSIGVIPVSSRKEVRKIVSSLPLLR
jgi:hypothetical protein